MKNPSLGFLTAAQFKIRKSKTLSADPTTKLNEAYEITQYLQKHERSYLDEIANLAQVQAKPLSNDVRVIVTIVASQEGSRITKALSAYLEQDLARKYFEIIILDNHTNKAVRDNTAQAVRMFQAANPGIAIIYAYKVWTSHDFATVGNARKYVFDMALARIHARNESSHETILISNDADTIDLDGNYLSAIYNEFQDDHRIDALVTPSVVPFATLRKPNIFAVLSLWDALDDAVASHEPRNLIGRSAAYRASVYAAIGGYNPSGKLAGDLETGFLIADAREWDPHSVILLKKTKQVTDPRRILEAVASRLPVNEMYFKFVTSPQIRQANNSELLGMVSDDFDWELFEEDADSFLSGGDTGMYKWRGSRFDTDFSRAMKNIGVKYTVKNQRLYVNDISQLIENYRRVFGETPVAIHSTRRPYNPARAQQIKQYFSAVSDSAIAARKMLAERTATELKEARRVDNKIRVEQLKAKYDRLILG